MDEFAPPRELTPIGRHLAERDYAVGLLKYALNLRMYGERAPGGNETWATFDQRCEIFLRKVRGLPTGDEG